MTHFTEQQQPHLASAQLAGNDAFLFEVSRLIQALDQATTR
ncbi:MAG: hypothetical protein OXG17_04815 [Chloroflexi bacterium]|nr:hypothetical protein [Chloroflexota bacterium]